MLPWGFFTALLITSCETPFVPTYSAIRKTIWRNRIGSELLRAHLSRSLVRVDPYWSLCGPPYFDGYYDCVSSPFLLMYLCVFLCILIYFTFLYSENPATTPAMKPRTNSTYPTFYCRKTRQVYGLRISTNHASDGDYVRCIVIDTLSHRGHQDLGASQMLIANVTHYLKGKRH